MSGVAIIRHLLASSAGLTAVVPATRIRAGVFPTTPELPAITVTQISAQQHNNVPMASAQYLVTERVQVTVHASQYHEIKQVLALVRAACPLSRGTVNGFTCDAVLPDVEGPDLYDHVEVMHTQSQDYMVTFHR